MKGPINNERATLDGQLKWLERWLVFSGSVVVVGVFIEIGSKLLTGRIDNEVIGGGLVIIGVAAEVAIGRAISLKSDRIRMIADLEVSAANEAAAKAEIRAGELQLETERLRSQLAWRSINSDQFAKLTKDLLSNPGSVQIEYMHGDVESMYFAFGLEHAFKYAKWNAGLYAGSGFCGLFGIVVPRPDGKTFGWTATITASLSNAGIGFKIMKRLPEWAGGVVSMPPPPEPCVRILVGPKMPFPPPHATPSQVA